MFDSSVAETYLQAVSKKHPAVLAKLELPHFIETASVHSWHCRILCQVQEIVLHKMGCTHSNIWVELFWNCVVNTTLPLISSCVLFWKPKQSSLAFTMKHCVSTTWLRRQQQHYSDNNSSAFFLCMYVWAVFRKSSHTVM